MFYRLPYLLCVMDNGKKDVGLKDHSAVLNVGKAVSLPRRVTQLTSTRKGRFCIFSVTLNGKALIVKLPRVSTCPA